MIFFLVIILETMFNFKGKITTKLLESPFIWLYGSKGKAKLDVNNFLNNPLYTSQEEAFRAFANADFWEYLIGWKEGKFYNLSKLIANIKNVDQVQLLTKITNPYQIELLMKKQQEKSTIGLKLLQYVWSKKSVTKQMICDEFGISNETLVKWIEFFEAQHWIQKSVAHVSEECKPYLSNLNNLKKDYKLSLLDYIQLHVALNKDNPLLALTFTKENLSYLINSGPSNLYKKLSYVIDNEELKFNIFPFTIFKKLAQNNGYDYNDEVLKNDMEEIFAKKSINSAVSESIITAS